MRYDIYLVIDDHCPNCKYIVNSLAKLGLINKIRLIKKHEAEEKFDTWINAVPTIIIYDIKNKLIEDKSIILGNTYGLAKLLMYLYKYSR